MPLYFLIHDAALFEGTIRPALAASWAQRSFSPCRSLWETLRPTVASFTERFHLDAEEMLLPKAGKDLPFDRGCWRLLAGERFRRAHNGALPTDLNELVPTYLPALPRDPFDGQPLRFKPRTTGYVVYSIGSDLRQFSRHTTAPGT